MRSLYRFLRYDVGARFPAIATYFHFWFAIYFAFAMVFPQYLLGKFIPPITFEFITDKLFDYNTTVVGFSLTAIAIVVAMPSGKFLDALRKAESKGKPSPLNNILFIITWNSVLHFFAFALILVIAFQVDTKAEVYKAVGSAIWFSLFVFWLIQFYAVIQFVITIISVFRIANSFANQLAKQK